MKPMKPIKHRIRIQYTVFAILLIVVPSSATADVSITAEQLADICETMEQSITDITVEYDWLITPANTIEELAEQGFTNNVAVAKDGVRHLMLSAGGLGIEPDEFDPNQFPKRFWLENSRMLLMGRDKSWQCVTTRSYDAGVGKLLNIARLRGPRQTGFIFNKKPNVDMAALTPLGFSIFRCVLTGPGWPLSKRLRLAGLTRVNDSVQKVNDFNSVSVDFLSEQKKRPYLRVYFSIDHGYTPVTHLYTKGSIDKVAFSFEVLSLQEVGEDLWFPQTGKVTAPGDPHVSVYAAKGDIKINQGLGPEDFDIDFPPGTEVHDEIRDVQYVVPAEQ